MLRQEKRVPVICPSSGETWTVYLLERQALGIKIIQVLWTGKDINSAKDIVECWLKGTI